MPEQLEKPQTEEETEEVIEIDVAEALAEEVREGADDLEMNEFREPTSSAAHGHSPDKGEGAHDIRSSFNVREDFIDSEFPDGVVPNGHEAVHVLLAGKSRFVEADEPIFSDTSDTDASRWKSIEDTASRAPIPPKRKSELEAQYK